MIKLHCGPAVGAFLLALATPAHAQTSVPTAVAAPTANVLRTGTAVPLRMNEELTTKGKKLRVGQRFRMEVVEAVSLGDQVVIPSGTPATGEIIEVRNKGMWGKSGKITARPLYLHVNGRQIRLIGTVDDKGKTGTAGVVAAIAVLPVAGFFTTGTSAVIPVGTTVTAFLDEDVPVAFAPAAAPAPMVVPVATPAPTGQ